MKEKFEELFKTKHDYKYFSPGRINILGEHIDYNGGYCLPMAIDQGTTALIKKNDKGTFRIYSMNFKDQGMFEIDPKETQEKKKEYGWSNLFRGMIYVLEDKLKNIPFGLDIIFDSNIPIGAGLSSSASVSMLIGTIFNDMFDLKLSTLDLVFLTQKMENKFLGANTGILDQYTIGFGKKDKALLLDTSVPSHKYFSSDFGEYVFLIVSTNKSRELADSKYNERVSECKKGLELINNGGIEVKNLCGLKPSQLNEVEKIIKDKIIFKRVRHCINEQSRTIEAAESLANIEKLGKLLYEGHESLRDDYEVTGEHLDFIYDFSKTKSYVAGARMTGAGFGGSAIVLIPKNKTNEYCEEFDKEYFNKFNIKPTFLVAKSAEGVHKC